MRKILSVIVILAMVFSISTPSFAASGYWEGTTSAVWSAGNWSASPVPGTGDTATFSQSSVAVNGNTTLSLSSPVTVSTVAFTAGAAAYTIGTSGAQSLTLNDTGAITVASGVANPEVISAGLTLGTDGTSQTDTITNSNTNSETLTLGAITGSASGAGLGTTIDTLLVNGSANTAITGAISNSSNATVVVTQSGTGVLTLTGTNTYTGGTNLSSGTLVADSAQALGTAAAPLAISGGTLDIQADSTAYNTTVSGNATIDSDKASSSAGVTYTLGTLSIGADQLTLAKGANATGTTAGLTFGATTLSASGAIFTANTATTLTLGSVGLASGGGYSFTVNGAGSTDITGAVNIGTGTLTQSGAGTLTLSGGSTTFTGGTLISSGTIEATSSATDLGTGLVTLSGGTLDLYNDTALAYDNNVSVTSNSAINSDRLTGGAGVTHTLGTLLIASGDTLTIGLGGTASSLTQGLTFGAVTLSGAAVINASTGGAAGGLLTLASVSGSGDALTIEGTANTTISGTVNLSSLTLGTGANASTLTLNGASTIGTISFGSADTLDLNNNLTGGIDFNNKAGTVTVASGDSISAGVQNSTGTANKGTVNFLGSTTISGGNLGASTANEGLLAVNFEGGSSSLDNNIYATTTTLSNAATLTTVGGQRTIAGALTLAGTSTLNIGTTNLINSGVYTQGSGTSLDLTANSSTSYGAITSTGYTAIVNNGSTVNVTVAGYIPNGAALDIINTGATGVTGGSPTVNALYSNLAVDPFIIFTSSVIGNNDVLTANHSSTGFSSWGSNPNAAALGNVLDNETNPSADLTNILNTLEASSGAQVRAALNTLGPVVDRGIMDASTSSLNSFTGASLEHAQSVLALASSSGVSAGDQSLSSSLWGKQYGGYMDQGTREGIQGYNAWNEGTTLGVDHLFNDDLTVGASLGYAYGEVNSDANSANADISSAQGTIYAGYQGVGKPYYVDLAGSIAENWYNGNRSITVDTINRVAESQYRGTQTGIYLEGGYKLDAGNNWTITPLTSLQWTHLNINGYSETNAGDLETLEQIIKNVNKLVDIIHCEEHPANTVEKELALLKTKASGAVKAFVTKNASKFHIRIDDTSDGCYIIEQTGTTAQLDEFEGLLKKFGILEMIRTGKILITRGREET